MTEDHASRTRSNGNDVGTRRKKQIEKHITYYSGVR